MPSTQQRLRKYERQPQYFVRKAITKRSLSLIAAVSRYRFASTSLITQVVEGDARTTTDHLQLLYHRGYLNRFQMGWNQEFIYYIDSVQTLRFLIAETGCDESELDFEAVRNNREKNYAGSDDPGKRLFIQHELMISRFQAMVELACRRSKGRVRLIRFRQGAPLKSAVNVPELAYDSRRASWYETDKNERLPHWPDALFTLGIKDSEGPERAVSFLYEADRKTTTKLERMRRKFRAHFHFVVKQRKHKEVYGVEHIRGVLVETLDGKWAETLRTEAAHVTVSGPKPSPFFLFTTSTLFTKVIDLDEGKSAPVYVLRPETVFDRIWAAPAAATLVSMLD